MSQRGLDHRDPRHRDLAGAGVVAVAHPLDERLDRERV
jgi:hypothetical protein